MKLQLTQDSTIPIHTAAEYLPDETVRIHKIDKALPDEKHLPEDQGHCLP